MRFYALTACFLLLLLSTSSQAIPSSYLAPDASGDVELLDGNYGGHSEGDLVSMDFIDITQLNYDFVNSSSRITLGIDLVGAPVLNATITYSVTVSINRYEGNSAPLTEASFAAAYLGGGSSSSMVYHYANGTSDTSNVPINASTTASSISWVLDVSGYPALNEIFGLNTTSLTLQGYAEWYPDALTGSTNARFYDEARLEWPVVPDDTTDENKSPLPFSALFVVALPVAAVIRKRA